MAAREGACDRKVSIYEVYQLTDTNMTNCSPVQSNSAMATYLGAGAAMKHMQKLVRRY
jgi:hypothetical protein